MRSAYLPLLLAASYSIAAVAAYVDENNEAVVTEGLICNFVDQLTVRLSYSWEVNGFYGALGTENAIVYA